MNKIISLAVCLNLMLATRIVAGPPFLTDDPEPVDYRHWEAYLFTLGDYSGGYTIEGPAVEVNYGVLPDTQLHLIVPMTTVSGGGRPTATGLGDTEFGIKYRFVHETNSWPQIGVFPFAELPTGDASRGLGNGRTWFQLPLWLQKSFGPWTTYGGGGEVLNSAPGERNHPYGGWLIQRDFGKHLTLGAQFRRLIQSQRAFQSAVQCGTQCCRRRTHALVFRTLLDLVTKSALCFSFGNQ
jgi:hypothetical protein